MQCREVSTFYRHYKLNAIVFDAYKNDENDKICAVYTREDSNDLHIAFHIESFQIHLQFQMIT